MQTYPWAENRAKLERAIGELGTDASEEAIKARYIEMAGRVLNAEGEHEEVVVQPEITLEDEVVEKPKKTKKK